MTLPYHVLSEGNKELGKTITRRCHLGRWKILPWEVVDMVKQVHIHHGKHVLLSSISTRNTFKTPGQNFVQSKWLIWNRIIRYVSPTTTLTPTFPTNPVNIYGNHARRVGEFLVEKSLLQMVYLFLQIESHIEMRNASLDQSILPAPLKGNPGKIDRFNLISRSINVLVI